MPLGRPQLDKGEQKQLVAHAQKHKNYPFQYRFNKTINASNFPTADASGTGSYFTLTYQPREIIPQIMVSANFIVTPAATVDIFAVVMSYKPSMSFADNANAAFPDDEAGPYYMLLSNGGAINDFQVFYPTNMFIERNTPVYIHVFAGATTVTAATSTIRGQVIIGTLPTGS